MKRLLLFFMILLLIICIPGRTVSAGDKEPITSKDQLNKPGKKIGVGVGSAAMVVVENELPEAELVYIEMNEGLQALEQGKIDAYVYARRQMSLAVENGNKNVELLDQNMDEKSHVAVGISPVTMIDGLENKLNTFIDDLHDDGTLDDMFSRWVLKK